MTRMAVAGLAETITGDEVDLDRMGSGEEYDRLVDGSDGDGSDGAASATSVYQAGPTPGWERGYAPTVSTGRGTLYSFRPVSTGCLTLGIPLDAASPLSDEPSDPFGPIDRPTPDIVDDGNTLGIEDDYERFGEVALGGPTPPVHIWSSLNMFGMHGGACNFQGTPILGLGGGRGGPVILR